jgi:predicted membrane metal-binding protein
MKLINFGLITRVILAMVFSTMLIRMVGFKNNSESYNKIIRNSYSNYLSPDTLSLIILMTTGDLNFKNNKLNEIFMKNQIIHLLVLSGSNLIIVSLFLSPFISKNSYSYIVLNYSYLGLFFVYTSYLHPVARALLFMSLNDLQTILGLKFNFYKKLLLTFIITLMGMLILNFSISFALSSYFALSIIVFSQISKRLRSLLKTLLFPIYMTIVSIPTILLFNSFDFKISLLSNYLVVPIFEFFSFYSYLFYILSFLIHRCSYLAALLGRITNFLFNTLFNYLAILNSFNL